MNVKLSWWKSVEFQKQCISDVQQNIHCPLTKLDDDIVTAIQKIFLENVTPFIGENVNFLPEASTTNMKNEKLNPAKRNLIPNCEKIDKHYQLVIKMKQWYYAVPQR